MSSASFSSQGRRYRLPVLLGEPQCTRYHFRINCACCELSTLHPVSAAKAGAVPPRAHRVYDVWGAGGTQRTQLPRSEERKPKSREPLPPIVASGFFVLRT